MQSGPKVTFKKLASFTVIIILAMHPKAIALFVLPISLLLGVAMAKNHTVISITFSPSESAVSINSWFEVEDELPLRDRSQHRRIKMGDPSHPVYTVEVGHPSESSVTTKQRRFTAQWNQFNFDLAQWSQFDFDLFKLCLLVNKTPYQLFISETLHRTPRQSVLDEWLCQASANGCIRVVRNLIEMGVDPKKAVSGRHVMTALHWAALNGHEGVVKVLLDRGVHPDTNWPPVWCTPFHFATSRGHGYVVKLLLDFGADPNWDLRICGYADLQLRSDTEEWS